MMVTDAGRFQTFASSAPSVTIGYPTRYIHSHAAVYHQDDFDNGVTLLTELVKRLDAAAVRDIHQQAASSARMRTNFCLSSG